MVGLVRLSGHGDGHGLPSLLVAGWSAAGILLLGKGKIIIPQLELEMVVVGLCVRAVRCCRMFSSC